MSGGGSVLRRLPLWRGVLILNYHRIGDGANTPFDRNIWSASVEDFRDQLDIVQRHCEVIGLEDLEQALTTPRGRLVMITFDDGYRDNYTEAFTALRERGMPATFFLTTGFLDQPQVPWWDEVSWMVRTTRQTSLPPCEWFSEALPTDPEHADDTIPKLLRLYKKLSGAQTPRYLSELAEMLQTGRCSHEIAAKKWMTWDMVREMRSQGMTIGGHSVTHPVLSTITEQQQDYEIGECRRRLIEELGEPIEAFSYPVGGNQSFNQFTADALARHGYRWGFTYLGGYVRPGQFNRYALHRAAVETNIDIPSFRAMVTLPQVFA